MSSLRALAEAVGLKDTLGSRREAAVTQIIQHLIETPASELERAVELSQNTELGSIGDFQAWFDLILDKRKVSELEPRPESPS
jgi:hypothetical protein